MINDNDCKQIRGRGICLADCFRLDGTKIENCIVCEYGNRGEKT